MRMAALIAAAAAIFGKLLHHPVSAAVYDKIDHPAVAAGLVTAGMSGGFITEEHLRIFYYICITPPAFGALVIWAVKTVVQIRGSVQKMKEKAPR